MGAKEFSSITNLNVQRNNFSIWNLGEEEFVSFQKIENLDSTYRIEKKVKKVGVILNDECISRIIREEGFSDDVLRVLETLQGEVTSYTQLVVEIHSIGLYEEILKFGTESMMVGSYGLKTHTIVNTEYKTVAKKVKPVTTQLPTDSENHIKKAEEEPRLRGRRHIGYKFIEETLAKLKIGGNEVLYEVEKNRFQEMIFRHGKAFASSPDEIGCVNPKIVAPMVIFIVPHVPWDLKPIPVPRALLPKLVDLLKEKLQMGILEPSITPYSNRWFTVPKKSGALKFIQDMQPANKVTIRNKGSSPIVDEIAKAFARYAIYSIGDLYSCYDQFQLASESRDLTTMKTPLGLMRMYTLPQGATNSVAHIQSAMNRIMRKFVPEKTIPFVDDIPIKGCKEEIKDSTLDVDGYRRFVKDHIEDVEKILKRLEEVDLTLSIDKSKFGIDEILVVGHLCGRYGRKSNHEKVDVITRMKACSNITEVRRFLGACIFYQIWIPQFAHIGEPLYYLLQK